MTTYSDNLRIPHLSQNIAEPEIPENTAKDIVDQFLTATYTIDADSDADITITHSDSPTGATNWQSFIIEITDDSDNLTVARNVILPDNPRPYVFKNNTDSGTGGVNLTFKTSSGTGFDLNPGANAYGYSNGTNIERLNFIASGAGTTIESLNDTPTGYGSDGQVLVSDGVDSFTFEDIVSTIGGSTDVTADYGSDGQVLVTNGVDAFTYEDISGTFIGLDDVDPTEYVEGDAGKAVIVNQAEDGLEFGVAGITLEGPNEITDESGVAYGTIFTGTAAINFSTDATTGTGLMYGTQGLVGINTDVKFFNIDPTANETLLLGANTKVEHADASVTSLNNPEWIAQNAQRTADIALKNTMDINMAIDTLAKASKLTLTAVGSETGAGEYTFTINP